MVFLPAKEYQRLSASHQKLGERLGMDPSLTVLRRKQPCQHLDLIL